MESKNSIEDYYQQNKYLYNIKRRSNPNEMINLNQTLHEIKNQDKESLNFPNFTYPTKVIKDKNSGEQLQNTESNNQYYSNKILFDSFNIPLSSVNSEGKNLNLNGSINQSYLLDKQESNGFLEKYLRNLQFMNSNNQTLDFNDLQIQQRLPFKTSNLQNEKNNSNIPIIFNHKDNTKNNDFSKNSYKADHSYIHNFSSDNKIVSKNHSFSEYLLDVSNVCRNDLQQNNQDYSSFQIDSFKDEKSLNSLHFQGFNKLNENSNIPIKSNENNFLNINNNSYLKKEKLLYNQNLNKYNNQINPMLESTQSPNPMCPSEIRCTEKNSTLIEYDFSREKPHYLEDYSRLKIEKMNKNLNMKTNIDQLIQDSNLNQLQLKNFLEKEKKNLFLDSNLEEMHKNQNLQSSNILFEINGALNQEIVKINEKNSIKFNENIDEKMDISINKIHSFSSISEVIAGNNGDNLNISIDNKINEYTSSHLKRKEIKQLNSLKIDSDENQINSKILEEIIITNINPDSMQVNLKSNENDNINEEKDKRKKNPIDVNDKKDVFSNKTKLEGKEKILCLDGKDTFQNFIFEEKNDKDVLESFIIQENKIIRIIEENKLCNGNFFNQENILNNEYCSNMNKINNKNNEKINNNENFSNINFIYKKSELETIEFPIISQFESHEREKSFNNSEKKQIKNFNFLINSNNFLTADNSDIKKEKIIENKLKSQVANFEENIQSKDKINEFPDINCIETKKNLFHPNNSNESEFNKENNYTNLANFLNIIDEIHNDPINKENNFSPILNQNLLINKEIKKSDPNQFYPIIDYNQNPPCLNSMNKNSVNVSNLTNASSNFDILILYNLINFARNPNNTSLCNLLSLYSHQKFPSSFNNPYFNSTNSSYFSNLPEDLYNLKKKFEDCNGEKNLNDFNNKNSNFNQNSRQNIFDKSLNNNFGNNILMNQLNSINSNPNMNKMNDFSLFFNNQDLKFLLNKENIPKDYNFELDKKTINCPNINKLKKDENFNMSNLSKNSEFKQKSEKQINDDGNNYKNTIPQFNEFISFPNIKKSFDLEEIQKHILDINHNNNKNKCDLNYVNVLLSNIQNSKNSLINLKKSENAPNTNYNPSFFNDNFTNDFQNVKCVQESINNNFGFVKPSERMNSNFFEKNDNSEKNYNFSDNNLNISSNDNMLNEFIKSNFVGNSSINSINTQSKNIASNYFQFLNTLNNEGIAGNIDFPNILKFGSNNSSFNNFNNIAGLNRNQENLFNSVQKCEDQPNELKEGIRKNGKKMSKNNKKKNSDLKKNYTHSDSKINNNLTKRKIQMATEKDEKINDKIKNHQIKINPKETKLKNIMINKDQNDLNHAIEPEINKKMSKENIVNISTENILLGKKRKTNLKQDQKLKDFSNNKHNISTAKKKESKKTIKINEDLKDKSNSDNTFNFEKVSKTTETNNNDFSPIIVTNPNLHQNYSKVPGDIIIREKEVNIIPNGKKLTEKEKRCELKSKIAKDKKEVSFSYYIDEEKNKYLRQQIQEFTKIYPEELEKTLENKSHRFMFSNFPEMYKKVDNFFLNFVFLNRKRFQNHGKTSAEIEHIKKFAAKLSEEENKFEKVYLKKLKLQFYDTKINDKYNEGREVDTNQNKILFKKYNKISKIDNILSLKEELNPNDNTKTEIELIFPIQRKTDKYSEDENENFLDVNRINICHNSKDNQNYTSQIKEYENEEFYNINIMDSIENRVSMSNKNQKRSKKSRCSSVDGFKECKIEKIIVNPMISVENLLLYDINDDIINTKLRGNYLKLWDPENLDDEEVKNYISDVEKIWPFADHYWSQELALEFLMINSHKIEETKEMIKNKDEKFEKFMKKRENKIDFHTCNKFNEIDTRRPAKKSLRSNKSNGK